MAEDQYTTLLEKLSTLQISMDTANASLSAMDKNTRRKCRKNQYARG
jgi:hypothetical protein